MSSVGGVNLLGTLLEGVNYRTRPRYSLKENQGEQEMKMNFNTRSVRLDDERYKVTLITSLVFSNEETAPFVLEVLMSGIFSISSEYDEDDLKVVLNVNCPSLLLPYAREMVANLSMRSEYGTVSLPSVNFMHLYQQRQTQQSEQQSAESGESETAQS